jgi:hypothetical protein
LTGWSGLPTSAPSNRVLTLPATNRSGIGNPVAAMLWQVREGLVLVRHCLYRRRLNDGRFGLPECEVGRECGDIGGPRQEFGGALLLGHRGVIC